MNEQARKQRNALMMGELYPVFRNKIMLVITDMEGRGFRPRIQQAWRSEAEQLVYFNKGTSKVKYGFHNCTGAKGEKESLAVDMLDDDFPLNSRVEYLLNLADASANQGLITGIRWGLTKILIAGLEDALRCKDFKRVVKIGFDPTHIEPTGINLQQAKAGKRI